MADVKLQEACRETGMSKFFFYRLPRNTPGLVRYGRAFRVDVDKLRAWMKSQTERKEHAR